MAPPATTARAAMRASLRMNELLSRGTNGNSAYTPFGRGTQALKTHFIKVLRGRPNAGVVRLVLWAAFLSLVAVGLALWFSLTGWRFGSVYPVLALAAVAAVAEAGRVRLTSTLEQSISLVPTLFAAVMFGPLASMFVSAASLSLDARRPPHLRWVTYTSSRAITGAMAGLAAAEAPKSGDGKFTSFVVATVIAAAVAESLDLLFAVSTTLLRGMSAGTVVRTLGPLVPVAVSLYAPVIALLAFAYQQVSPWTLVFFFGPALAAQRLYGMYQDQRRLASDLTSANVRLERASLSFATALVATLDARDRYTAGHSAAVAIYARDIATRLALTEEEQQLAHLCGLVHDIGKIGLPAGLLEKPGSLTLEERRQMQEHSAIGERILAKVEDYAEIARIVRHHHERWDGQGYPDGLSNENIPLISRIIAVADAYNAMTSDRPYRDAMPSRVARLRLAQGVESQFDTTVVAAFEAILAGVTEDYRVAAGEAFTFAEQDRYSAPESVAEVA
jgi:putative nucleotidyltransferase with HDIG domain